LLHGNSKHAAAGKTAYQTIRSGSNQSQRKQWPNAAARKKPKLDAVLPHAAAAAAAAAVAADHGASLEASDKMRLLMAYIATHPEKLDPVKRAQWQKLARLDDQDMAAVCNVAFLNVAVMKQPGAQVRAVLYGAVLCCDHT
jgi:hypothetical protein